MKFLMWIKRIAQQLRDHNTRAHYRTIQVKYQALPERKPNRQHTAELLALVDPERFRLYTPSHGHTVKLSVDVANLEAFTKKLVDAATLVMREMPVPANWMLATEIPVTFDWLFVSNDGYYLDIVSSINKFKIAGLRLCELMKESDTATHGIHEHNFRMLSRLLVQLREMSICVLEVSLQR